MSSHQTDVDEKITPLNVQFYWSPCQPDTTTPNPRLSLSTAPVLTSCGRWWWQVMSDAEIALILMFLSFGAGYFAGRVDEIRERRKKQS